MKAISLLAGSLLLLIACSSPKPAGGLPPQLEGTVEPDLIPIREVIDLTKKKATMKTYGSFENGIQEGAAEKQWTRVYVLPGGLLRYREVYNIYKDQAGKVEYSVWEMDVNPTDTTRRQFARDYQAIVTADTAYYASIEPQYVHARERLDIPVDGDTMKVYKLEGYAHAADLEPGHIKFWTQDLGTLLIWTGNGRTFELTKVPGFGKEKLDQLMKTIKQGME